MFQMAVEPSSSQANNSPASIEDPTSTTELAPAFLHVEVVQQEMVKPALTNNSSLTVTRVFLAVLAFPSSETPLTTALDPGISASRSIPMDSLAMRLVRRRILPQSRLG
jgi:hypothetical protein